MKPKQKERCNLRLMVLLCLLAACSFSFLSAIYIHRIPLSPSLSSSSSVSSAVGHDNPLRSGDVHDSGRGHLTADLKQHGRNTNPRLKAGAGAGAGGMAATHNNKKRQQHKKNHRPSQTINGRRAEQQKRRDNKKQRPIQTLQWWQQQQDVSLASMDPNRTDALPLLAACNSVTPPDPITVKYANEASSVDYVACCGLGHRLSKMAQANYLADQLNYSLRVHWDWCSQPPDPRIRKRRGLMQPFHHFFGTQPLHEFKNVTSISFYLRINNETPGFRKFVRDGSSHCECSQHALDTNAEFYARLRRRFRYNDKVDAFYSDVRRSHNATAVIGLHVRAGNGESGDFVKKKRSIDNVTEWSSHVQRRILDLMHGDVATQQLDMTSPIVFVATDTISIVRELRTALQPHDIPVVTYTQRRLQNGTGVAFGQGANEQFLQAPSSSCLQHMQDGLMDMMILSHADVVISGRPSSFTQSLPMALASTAYCEFDWNATQMHCFTNALQWCCEGSTEFHMGGMTQKYEYLRMPDLWRTELNIQRRPVAGEDRGESDCTVGQTCPILPYDSTGM